MATVFVALPLVIREVVPVLQEVGDEQEQAASSLGANAVQTFRRITLPSIKWAVVYGVVLSLARSLGEYGAVKVVSGNVVGLALILVYNPVNGWFGAGLDDIGIKIIFSTPGMIMATTFVALPLVIREVVPVLEEIGDDQEWAARSLGASPFQVLRRITLPSIKWAIVYGVVLALARSIGEFGAVKIVSGNIVGSTQTATTVVEERYQNFDQPTAYAISFLLAFVSVICIVLVAALRPKQENR